MLKQTFSQKPNIKINQKINNNIINSIKILQMSSNEIEEFTKKEIEKNPFLMPSKRTYTSNENSNLENHSKNSNVKEWLYQQSSLIASNNEEELLIKVYIESLDNYGFCKVTATEAAQLSNVSVEQSKIILLRLKLLDPVGIFSNSISEHLSFQLHKRGILDFKYEILINNLKHVVSGNLNKLAELCELEMDQIISMINNIKSLKPRPLEELEEERIATVIPDILVTMDNKKINISLYNENYYQVFINEKYVNQMKIKQKELSNIELKKYIQESIAHGKTLQKNLNRRSETILLVAKTVLFFQKMFFFNGEAGVLPLTHKYISKKLFMNESTISRAVKNKYIKYNNKILPLSYFFTSRTNNNLNIENNSSISIKAKIKQEIASEKRLDIIFSDQKIVNRLKKESIIISRRTVAKYRESLKIPNSLIRSKKN